MSIQYYEPFFSLSDFHRLFDDTVSSRNTGGNNQRNEGQRDILGTFQPKIDVHESQKENSVTATFELPGLKKEDVSIDVHNNRLIVSGETKSEKDVDHSGYVVRERRSGKFSRTLPLPAGTQPEQIKASMENGVLTVTFPKSSPEQAAKRVNIS